MRSNKIDTIQPETTSKSFIKEDIQNQNLEESNSCFKSRGYQTISHKLQCSAFVLYTIVSIGIFISRIFQISIDSDQLDQYGQNYQVKYRLIDFQQMTNQFFKNFDYQFGQTKHALDVINDIYNIAEIRFNDYDFSTFSRCHINNVTLCISQNKDEEITYKLRADSFYQIYYFFTSSIYLTNNADESAISPSQQAIVTKTSMFESFYFNAFQHFYFTNNLHHKMFIVFPNDKVARIFPVQYDSIQPISTNDYTMMRSVMTGTQPNTYWKLDQNSPTYQYFSNLSDVVNTDQDILRIRRVIKRNSDNSMIGVVSVDIFTSHINNTMSQLLNSNYQTYLISNQGDIIQTNIENFTDDNIFTSLQGCYCEQVVQKFKSLKIHIPSNYECQQPQIPYSIQDCMYFNMKEMWQSDGQYLFFLITISNNYQSNKSDQLIYTIIYVYISLFIVLFAAIIYITRTYILEFTSDITNPIKQVSFKIQRIMHNIFNPKQFSKIRTDEIVIREKTEIRKLANKFSKTFYKLNEKNLFQTTIVSSIDKSYQKSKEISDKPQKDTIVDEVRNIVQSFLDDQQQVHNEQTQERNNKYARSNKSKNNIDSSLIRD
ncbi:transmembrane protein, putative (macronuclear) [Tetrahymena thermophila SB210]|uniref:Transmembrane protein, putative n=1 Tax=Tetrahymena thermophila (strain SB210) TaxID=312017 RepID=W7XCA4_TETTS|nr:transmembrane protein, putative [Tetrahymena thermophila SB210]EWS71361.1 transmembrane protein, putative [Tetrahymena thermophila SB210]|eukprot:XP_012656094.1 transmembrane protein, putative [Tetrahymena thermophila SB210]